MNDLPVERNGSMPSLQDRTEHRAWIKGRAATLLSHYWREGDDPALVAAQGRDWADVLEGLPQDVIQKACIQYQRDEPRRRPTPGAIYDIAMKLMPRPSIVWREPVVPMPREQADAYMEHVRRDNINEERRQAAQAILERAGFAKRMNGGDE